MGIRTKLTAVVVGVLVSLVICVGSASAETCNNVLIEEIGMMPEYSPDQNSQNDDYFVRVKCEANWDRARYYYLSTDLGDAGYATLLSAYSLDKPVRLELGGYQWYSIIHEIRVLN